MASMQWDSLLANSASVLGTRLAVPLLNVALVVSVARVLGVAELGQYTLLTTLYLLWENLKSLGLPTLMIREIAREGEEGLAHYSSLVVIGLGGGLFGIVALALVALAKSGTSSVLLPAFIISLGLLPSAFVLPNDALFLALGQARHSIKIAYLENVVRLACSLAAVWAFHGRILSLCTIYALTRGIAAAMGAVIIRRKLKITLPPHDRALTWKMLKRAPVFATIFVFPLVLFRMDVVLLGFLDGNYAVGLYSAAMRLVALCLIVPDSLMSATFAVLSRFSAADSLSEFRRIVQRTIRWMTLLLLPTAIIGWVAAPEIIRILYGHSFAPAVPLLQLLLWGLLPFAVNRALGDALVAQGRQSTVAGIILTTVAISIGIYLFLVPKYGITGAAWGFVISVFLMCSLTIVWGLRRTRLVDPVLVAMSLATGVLALGVAAARHPLNSAPDVATQAVVSIVGICVVVAMAMMELQRWRLGRAMEAGSTGQQSHLGAVK